MTRRLTQILSGVFVLLLFSPRYALAQGWFEWGTQGSYVHQFAHLLFFAAMVFFIFAMRHEKLQRYRGFLYLIWGCAILAWWNLDSVAGHTLEWGLTNPVILGHGLSERLLMENTETWLYYITKIDHFALLIPAFYLYYRGLKVLAQESQSETP
ncbi:MAG: hypothetical protein PHU44_02190 [Syntrophales bacterium]|nr:hypothetical protein [Syntrophales bacterium]MDD5640742.1 hypothetical protein [Syntrophales bacterium]